MWGAGMGHCMSCLKAVQKEVIVVHVCGDQLVENKCKGTPRERERKCKVPRVHEMLAVVKMQCGGVGAWVTVHEKQGGEISGKSGWKKTSEGVPC